MKEWTREERYRELQNAEEILPLHKKISSSVYRQTYHVQPVTGLSSDPNGFSWYQGQWHLCYQWCPWGAVHGLKYWYHVSSPDLVHWKNEGIGMKPDTYYDNKGVHSGSGIAVDDSLYFFYTGNHRDENWIRTPYTCAAKLETDGRFVKLSKPLFGPKPDFSEHQRDPKVFYNAQKQKYFIFIGAQSTEHEGCILVYESEQLLKDWHFSGRLKLPGYDVLGDMWECPCIGRIGNKDILIFSPQHIKLPGRAMSTNHTIYIIGAMDFDTLTFTPESDFRHLDYGFDFYAAQLAANVNAPDKAVMIAWMGLPDNHYTTADEDWEGSMTLPRELRIKNGRLFQTPVDAVKSLRIREVLPGNVLPPACELEVAVTTPDFDMAVFTAPDNNGGIKIHYDACARICTVNKTGLANRFNENIGEELAVPLENKLEHLRIFIDHSSIEFFFNHGEAVFTSHIYPTQKEHGFHCTEGCEVRIWELHPSVKDNFII